MFREATGILSVTRGESGHKVSGRNFSTVQKLGLRYERKVEQALSYLVWKLGKFGPTTRVDFQVPLNFTDSNGFGAARIDFLLTHNETIFVGETKLTWTIEAVEKLQKLYLPLVMHLLGSVDVRGLIICKSLTPEAVHSTPIVAGLSALLYPQPESIFTFPWRGQRPMVW